MDQLQLRARRPTSVVIRYNWRKSAGTLCIPLLIEFAKRQVTHRHMNNAREVLSIQTENMWLALHVVIFEEVSSRVKKDSGGLIDNHNAQYIFFMKSIVLFWLIWIADKHCPVQVSLRSQMASRITGAAASKAGHVYTHGHATAVVANHAARTCEDFAPHILNRLRLGDSILDVGCGPGSITKGQILTG